MTGRDDDRWGPSSDVPAASPCGTPPSDVPPYGFATPVEDAPVEDAPVGGSPVVYRGPTSPAAGSRPAPPPVAWYPSTDQVRVSSAAIVVTWLIIAATSFYLLPWAIAMSRGKADRWGVFWLNLLLGWTVIGWIWAFVWCLLPHHVVAVAPTPGPWGVPPGWYQRGDGRYAYWDGARWTGHIA